jgi:hypothetical protein
MRRGDAVILVGMVALFLACVVRDPRSETLPFLSFHPLPDAIEYAVGAAALADGRGLGLTIDGVTIPSRYPPGFPLLIALAYGALGKDVANAYWVSIACGVVALPLMFLLARALVADPAVARWGTFFLTTNALVLSFAPLVMSELCSLLLALAALNLAVRLTPTSRASAFAALGCVLGFATVVRTANVLMIALSLVALVMVHGRPSRPRQWIALGAPLAFAAAGLAVHNAAVFGSPLRDGYAFYTPRTMFAWEFFTAHAPSYFRTLALASGGKTLWLDGPFYGLLVPALAAVGIVALHRAGRRDALVLAGAWVVTFFVFFASYFFHDVRFFVPVLPIVLLMAACGAAALMPPQASPWRPAFVAIVAGLYLIGPVGHGTSPLDAIRQNRLGQDPPANHVHVRALNAYMDRIEASAGSHVVVTALNLVYADHFSNHRYLLVPLSPHQEYARVPEVQARMPWADVDRLLAEGRQVYVSDFATDDDDAKAAFGALAARHRLEPITDAGLALARVHRGP